MKRETLFSVILVVLFNFAASAQNTPSPVRPRFGIGPEIAFPTGAFGNMFDIGLGGSGKLEIPITSALYATATAGFTSFYAKTRLNGQRVSTDNKSYIPLKAGARYYVTRGFYGEGELGASVGMQKYAGTAFAWAGGIGFLFPVNEKHAIDVGVRSEKWVRQGGNINQVALKAAFQF